MGLGRLTMSLFVVAHLVAVSPSFASIGEQELMSSMKGLTLEEIKKGKRRDDCNKDIKKAEEMIYEAGKPKKWESFEERNTLLDESFNLLSSVANCLDGNSKHQITINSNYSQINIILEEYTHAEEILKHMEKTTRNKKVELPAIYYRTKGMLEDSRGNLDDANGNFAQAYTLDPNDPLNIIGLASNLEKNAERYRNPGEYEEADRMMLKAGELYEEAIKSTSEFPQNEFYKNISYDALIGSGFFNLSLRNVEKANQRFNDAIELVPERPEAYMGIGEMYFITGDIKNSEAYFQVANDRCSFHPLCDNIKNRLIDINK